MVRPTRSDWLVAGVCGAWVIFFDAGQGPAAIVLGFLTVLALLLRRRPMLASIGVLALTLMLWILESPEQSPAMFAPYLFYVYALGRYASLPMGLFWVTGFDVVLSGCVGWSAANLGFGMVLLGGPWIFGRLVRQRTEGARAAEQLLTEQEGRDPVALAAAVVAAERSRLAAEVVNVVRAAVLGMRAAAVRAADDLDPGALASIQDTGRAAIAELRRLLGLLRQDDAAPAPTETPPARRRTMLMDTAIAVMLAALMCGEALLDGRLIQPLSVVLSILFAATVIPRRRDPALACAAATVITAVSMAVQAPILQSIAFGVILVLLAWSVATNGRLRGWAALAALAVIDLVEVHVFSPVGETINLVAFALGALCGYLWAERSRVEQAALNKATALRDASNEHIERAVKAERLRLARELHDVASHAVGVMVLQAAAAQTLRGRDDTAARAAVLEVKRAGETALAELGALADVLDPQDLPSQSDPVDQLGARLIALIDRLRAGGVIVTTDLGELPPVLPAVDTTIHRVVQESLTNVLRHAPGSTVRVSARVKHADPTTVEVEVRDDGRTPAASSTGSGFGLIGLAERVRALGGDLAAGPHPAGGFAVRARIPLHGAAPRTLMSRVAEEAEL